MKQTMLKNAKINRCLEQILKSLKKMGPKMIMVFGSYSKGELDEDSDLDLLIVLNEREVPKTYDEKIEMKLRIRKSIREINKKIAIDLLVYTLPEYEEFVKGNSSFSKEIIETGRILYEKTS